MAAENTYHKAKNSALQGNYVGKEDIANLENQNSIQSSSSLARGSSTKDSKQPDFPFAQKRVKQKNSGMSL